MIDQLQSHDRPIGKPLGQSGASRLHTGKRVPNAAKRAAILEAAAAHGWNAAEKDAA